MKKTLLDMDRDYVTNCEVAKPYLPEGCRFLNIGEKVPPNAKHIGYDGLQYRSTFIDEEVRDGLLPIFVPAKYTRGAKGRFAKKIVYPNVKDIKHCFDLPDSIASCEKILSGDIIGILKAFFWDSAAPVGRTDIYWRERYHGRDKLSSADLDFIRAVKKEFEARLEAANPKPAPVPKSTLGEKIIKALEGRVTSLKTGAELAAFNKHYELAANNTRDAKTVEDIVALVKSLQ